MAEQMHSPSRGLSRQVVQLMLEVNGILRRHGISIALTGPHVYDEIVRASETIDDAELAQLRQHLIAAATHTQATIAKAATAETPSVPQPAVPESKHTAVPVQPSEALPQTTKPSDAETETASSIMTAASSTVQPTIKMVYPRDFQGGQLTCPQCHNAVVVSAAHLASDNPIPLQCGCGMQFKIGAESRKYPRKGVEFPGRYVLLKNGETGSVVVNNISFGGMQLRTNGDTSIQCDDELRIDFQLDDQSRSMVSVQASARYVLHQLVGVEFADTPDFSPQLALYLMQ